MYGSTAPNMVQRGEVGLVSSPHPTFPASVMSENKNETREFRNSLLVNHVYVTKQFSHILFTDIDRILSFLNCDRKESRYEIRRL